MQSSNNAMLRYNAIVYIGVDEVARRVFVSCYIHAKQKHLGVKKVRGQSEATCKKAGATKSFDIS